MKRQTSFSIFSGFVISVSLAVFTSVVSARDVNDRGYEVSPSTGLRVNCELVAGESKSEKLLYKNALRVIKKAEKRARISGTPYRISCQYKIKDDKTVSASTEVHYADYRKKSDSQSIEFAPVDGKLDRVVEFVYKPNSGVLAVVDRDPAKLSKRLATRRLQIDI